MSRSITVPGLLDLAEEFRRAGQLEPVRLANAANNDVALLREAVKAAHQKETDYRAAAARARERVDTMRGPGLEQEWKKQSGLADAWKANTTGLTAAAGLVLDRPQIAPTTRAATPHRSPHLDGTGTRFLGVGLVVHVESGTWYGQLRIQALPPIGSGLRLNAAHLLRISDVEMDLAGTFTVHAEVAPAAPTPSRGLLTKLGLTRAV